MKIAQDFARFTRRARECGGRILRYVTDKRASSNTVKRAKDKQFAQDLRFYARRRRSEERSILTYVSTAATESNKAEKRKDKQEVK